MKTLLLLLLAASAEAAVRYDVRATGEGARVLYAATVDGATDFDVVLGDAKFTLNAHFTAEGTGPVDLRVRLETRRREGTSKRGLPLWEIDSQQHRFRVRLGQTIELLPFGTAGPRGLLKLEIVPRAVDAAAPRVDITKSSSAIAVHAHRIPHRYEIRARIENAEARGTAFLGERTKLHVGDAELTISAEPAPYRDAWDAARVRFDGRWKNGTVFARSWEGIAAGQPLRYPIGGGRTLILEITPKE